MAKELIIKIIVADSTYKTVEDLAKENNVDISKLLNVDISEKKYPSNLSLLRSFGLLKIFTGKIGQITNIIFHINKEQEKEKIKQN